MIPNAHLEAARRLWRETSARSVCRLEGNCMAPVLREGDLLVIEHGEMPIRAGDVVVFGNPGKFVVHRVLRVTRPNDMEQLLVKADHEGAFHPLISRGTILGKVVEARGSNGHLMFNSVPWRILNYFLALRSYVAGRRHEKNTWFWRIVDALFLARSKILPKGFSLSLLPCKLMFRGHGKPSRRQAH